ncbi:hypothetical protein GCM10012285_47740 [Streptomyces kronopolitis]|uniref:Uncharacterized protein n=1 Tax=Streptomyces kronopolitis TaxID=1612435 RepID=A0ABQ2JU99_9ACTN|nr:hypothetical protein GCM10012285_47740 [Streptomyces kronopolitis]
MSEFRYSVRLLGDLSRAILELITTWRPKRVINSARPSHSLRILLFAEGTCRAPPERPLVGISATFSVRVLGVRPDLCAEVCALGVPFRGPLRVPLRVPSRRARCPVRSAAVCAVVGFAPVTGDAPVVAGAETGRGRRRRAADRAGGGSGAAA